MFFDNLPEGVSTFVESPSNFALAVLLVFAVFVCAREGFVHLAGGHRFMDVYERADSAGFATVFAIVATISAMVYRVHVGEQHSGSWGSNTDEVIALASSIVFVLAGLVVVCLLVCAKLLLQQRQITRIARDQYGIGFLQRRVGFVGFLRVLASRMRGNQITKTVTNITVTLNRQKTNPWKPDWVLVVGVFALVATVLFLEPNAAESTFEFVGKLVAVVIAPIIAVSVASYAEARLRLWFVYDDVCRILGKSLSEVLQMSTDAFVNEFTHNQQQLGSVYEYLRNQAHSIGIGPRYFQNTYTTVSRLWDRYSGIQFPQSNPSADATPA